MQKNETELTTLRDENVSIDQQLAELAEKYSDEGLIAGDEDIQRSEELLEKREANSARIKTIELCEAAKTKAAVPAKPKQASTSQWVRSKQGPTVKDRNNAFRAWALSGIQGQSRTIKDSWLRSADTCNINVHSNEWIVRDQTSDVDAEGGYSVNDSVHQTLVEAMSKIGGLQNVCEQINTDHGNDMHFSINDDTANSGAISAQAESVSNTGLTLDRVNLKIFTAKTGCFPVSFEYFQDASFDVGAMVGRNLGKRLARNVAAKVSKGGGTTEPDGLVPNATVGSTGYSNNLDLIAFQELYASVDSAYRQNAVWVMHDDTFAWIMFNLVDDNDRPLFWNSNMSLSDAPSLNLFGRPIIIDNSYDVMESGESRFPITFGDHSYHKYRVVSPGQVIVKDTSRYVDDLSVGFFGYQRYGSAYVNPGNDPVKSLSTGTLSGD